MKLVAVARYDIGPFASLDDDHAPTPVILSAASARALAYTKDLVHPRHADALYEGASGRDPSVCPAAGVVSCVDGEAAQPGYPVPLRIEN
jgi:hypothetical protein